MRQVIVLGLAMGLAIGCGSGGPRQDVAVLTGTVRYKGQPLGGGSVRAMVESGGQTDTFQTVIRADGTFRLEAKPGAARLGVETESLKMAGGRQPLNPKTGRPDPKAGADIPGYVPIPTKYRDSATSGLTAELRPGEQSQDLDLQ